MAGQYGAYAGRRIRDMTAINGNVPGNQGNRPGWFRGHRRIAADDGINTTIGAENIGCARNCFHRPNLDLMNFVGAPAAANWLALRPVVPAKGVTGTLAKRETTALVG